MQLVLELQYEVVHARRTPNNARVDIQECTCHICQKRGKPVWTGGEMWGKVEMDEEVSQIDEVASYDKKDSLRFRQVASRVEGGGRAP